MRNARGYTTTEIAVVLLFMAILGAIGTTALTGAKDKTNESTAKNHLEAAVTAQVNHLQQYGNYAVSPEELTFLAVAGTTYTTAASENQSEVNVTVTADGIAMAVAADDTTCVAVALDSEGMGPEPETLSTANGDLCTGALVEAP